MSEGTWIVYYRRGRSGPLASEAAVSRQTALEHACMHLLDGSDVHFIQGPQGAMVSRREIDAYCGRRSTEDRE